MLKPRIIISNTILCLLVASGCHRLPLSLGDGVDIWDDPGGSSGGAAGAPGSAGTSADVGGGPGLGECNATYLLCLESGERPEVCRDGFARCEAGVSVGGVGGGPGLGECDATYLLCLESGERPEVCRDVFARCEGSGSGSGSAGTSAGGSGSAGTGAGGEAGSPGVGGTGGYGSGGAAGDPGVEGCNTTYVLCLESGEFAEICRDELLRCEQTETGAAGTSG